jgi:hypothetical protein
MKRSVPAAVGCLALLVTACSGAEPATTTATQAPVVSSTTAATADPGTTSTAPTTAAPATTTTGAVTLPDPDPASAEVTLESSATVSAVVGSAGGTLAATGSDGRSYVLTIPPNYVAGDTEVTMTPIAGLATPILEEFAGGVQLGPDGLTLPGVVWLEISGADLPENAVGFSYIGDGEDAAIGWVETKGAAIRVPIIHFSGAGAGTPAPGADARYPHDAVTTMGITLTSAWIANGGSCLDDTNPIGEVLPSWYQALFESEVEPKLEKAVTDDTLLPDAIRAALRWRAARQYYEPLLCEELARALEEVPGNERLDQLVTQGLDNAIDTAADSCATTHDLGETRYILAWAANGQLLFGDENGDWSRLALERVAGCLTFELQFHSYVEVDNPGLLVFTGDMEATIGNLIPLANGLSLGVVDGEQDASGAGPLAYTPRIDFTYDESCPINVTRVETQLASALMLEVTIPAPTRQVPVNINREETKPPETANLVFYPLEGSEYFDASCTDLLGGYNPDGAWGPSTFNGLHEDEMSTLWEAFIIAMDRGTGKLYARATYQRELTKEGANIYEETTFDLFHAAPRVP